MHFTEYALNEAGLRITAVLDKCRRIMEQDSRVTTLRARGSHFFRTRPNASIRRDPV